MNEKFSGRNLDFFELTNFERLTETNHEIEKN
jgi:hypothetical protein